MLKKEVNMHTTKIIIDGGIKTIVLAKTYAQQFRYKEDLTKEELKIAIPIGWCTTNALQHPDIKRYLDIDAYHMRYKYDNLLLVSITNCYCWIPFLNGTTMQKFKKYKYPDQILIDD